MANNNYNNRVLPHISLYLDGWGAKGWENRHVVTTTEQLEMESEEFLFYKRASRNAIMQLSNSSSMYRIRRQEQQSSAVFLSASLILSRRLIPLIGANAPGRLLRHPPVAVLIPTAAIPAASRMSQIAQNACPRRGGRSILVLATENPLRYLDLPPLLLVK